MESTPYLSGTIRALFLYEVAEAIDIAALRKLLGADPAIREPSFRHPAPEYVRYERPSVIEQLGKCRLGSGLSVDARVRYFEYGVASVELMALFHGSWDDLVQFAHSWITSTASESCASTKLRVSLERAQPTLSKPHGSGFISEDYYIVQIDPVIRPDGSQVPAESVVRECGPRIAQIVRGEKVPLSNAEVGDVMQSSLSYYPQTF